MKKTDSCAPIGIFDSGIGGLSVFRAVRNLIPSQPILYLADQAHVPYGARSLEEIRAFSEEITRFLINQGAKLIVVACNTASAAALHGLRLTFPDMPFVGMEPAVKPASLTTTSGKVGVLATPATFQGQLYASVVERFARGIQIYQNTCPGLVQEIEKGNTDGSQTRKILEDALLPMLQNGVDVIVLSCTHYPFVAKLIHEITGPDVQLIDPAPAVARQAARLLKQFHLECTPAETGSTSFYTSGESAPLKNYLTLLGETSPIHSLMWNAGRLW